MSDQPKRSPQSISRTVAHFEEDVDPRVAELLDQYFEDLQAGLEPELESMLAAHPDIAEELRSCVESMQLVHGSTRPTKPQQLGDFQIIREVGRGGMGVVYEAQQQSLKRRVALKVLRYAVADADAMTRFRREAETVANLHHSNIVPIFAIGEAGGVNYFAMQFIDGQSLNEVLQNSETPLDAMDVAEWGLQAAEALSYAHEHDIIHRDVKPSNLILDLEGRCWLTDFGLAKRLDDVKLSMTGAVLGTPRYMSPEQASSVRRPVDHRTDIYSLGATLYELITNKPLFDAESPHVALGQIIAEEPVPPRTVRPKLSLDLETIIMRCLSKDANHRYESAQDLVQDLRAFLDGKAITARRPSWAEILGRWLQKNQRLVNAAATAATVAAVLIVGSAVAVRRYQESRLGHLQFSTLRDGNAPLIADVMNDDGELVVPSFTIPTQQSVAIPEGDYDLQLHSAGTISDSYRMSVTASKERVEIFANPEDQTLWEPRELEGPWVAWPRDGGVDFVVFGKRGLTLLDGQTSDLIWKTDLWSQAEAIRKAGLRWNSWDWWNPYGNSLAATKNYSFGYAYTNSEPIDCNADGVDDLVLALRYRAAMMAFSGKDGTLLWCRHVNFAQADSNSLRVGGVTRQPLVARVDEDEVPDLIAGFVGEADRTNYGVQAISGATGEVLWKYDVDPALHNTRRMPYAPYAARWYYEPDHEQLPSASNGRNAVWRYEHRGVESHQDHQGSWIAYGPAFQPSTAEQKLVIWIANECHVLDTQSGNDIAIHKLPCTPVRVPQWVDHDGDGTSEVLLCQRVLPTKQNGASQDDRTTMRVSLWDAELTNSQWQLDVEADWEWEIDQEDITREIRQWPLFLDLDGDQQREMVLPAETITGAYWKRLPAGKLQTIDLATGKRKWLSDTIIGMSGQLNHFANAGDVDRDGIRDLAVVTQYSGPESGRKQKEKSRLYIYVDVLSGKDGKQIGRMRSRPVEIQHSHSTMIKRVEYSDGSLLVEMKRPKPQDGANQFLTFDLAAQRLTSSTDRVRFPQLLDLDGDGARELIGWTPKDRGSNRGGGQMRVWRSGLAASTDWKVIGQKLHAIADIDRDGVDDALRMPEAPAGRNIDMISGATGRAIWKHDFVSSGTIHAHPTTADFDNDGAVDVLVGSYCPQVKKHTPLTALSGRTGRKLWEYKMEEPGSWDDHYVLGSVDLEQDGDQEVLLLVNGKVSAIPGGPTGQSPLQLTCITARGRLRWQRQLAASPRDSHSIEAGFRHQCVDADGDGVLDVLTFDTNRIGDELRCQIWSGVDGAPLWIDSAGLLREPNERPVSPQSWSQYPHVCVIEGAEPIVASIRCRNAVKVQALDAKTGHPVWNWTDDTWFSVRRGEGRLYGNPVPIPCRTPTGRQLGFWYVKNHPNTKGPDQQTCDLVLLDPANGDEKHRFEMFHQDAVNEVDLSWWRIWAVDLDADDLDEIVYSTPTHLVAYSLIDSDVIWKCPISSASHLINSVDRRADGTVEIRLITKNDLGRIEEIRGIDQRGQLVWRHQFSSGVQLEGTDYEWLDIMEQRSPPFAPRLLCRSAKSKSTLCRSVTKSDPTATPPGNGVPEGKERQAASRGASSQPLSSSLGPDPRSLRRLSVSIADDVFAVFLRSAVCAALLIVLPLAMLARLYRGRWTLKTMFILPLVVGVVLLVAQWPSVDRPSDFSVVGWNYFQGTTAILAWVPIYVLVRMILQATRKMKWGSVIGLLVGIVACTSLFGLNLLMAAGYFDEIGPVRYAWDGWWMCLFGGVQMFGILLCLWSILVGVAKRLARATGMGTA